MNKKKKVEEDVIDMTGDVGKKDSFADDVMKAGR